MTALGAAFAFREGAAADLRATFGISALAVHHTSVRMGVSTAPPPTAAQIDAEWRVQRDLIEFVAAQPGGDYWICEDGGEPVGYARVCRFDAVEQLTELMVVPSHHRRGIGRELLERCFPDDPTPERGRLIVAAGAPADLTLYTGFGVVPVSGHWHLRVAAPAYAERRAREAPPDGPAIAVIDPDRAVAAWTALEPGAIGHVRPAVHDFFARTRACLATLDRDGGVRALCWVGAAGDVGPAVARTPAELVPVVVAALDRVAPVVQPAGIGLYCSTANVGLLRRLRALGFRVHWPGWVMSSAPLPGLDRYLPMRPPHLL